MLVVDLILSGEKNGRSNFSYVELTFVVSRFQAMYQFFVLLLGSISWVPLTFGFGDWARKVGLIRPSERKNDRDDSQKFSIPFKFVPLSCSLPRL